MPRPRPRRAKGTKRTPPARSLPGHRSSSPGKTLAAVTHPAPTEQITLESTAPKGQGFGRHPRGGMQIFVKTHHCATLAACLPTWHRRRRWPGSVSTQDGAATTDEADLSPVPDKARTPKQDALDAPCHVMQGITSHHCTLSTSCVPLWQPLSL